VPYADLLRLSGYRVPDAGDGPPVSRDLTGMLFGDLTDDERDALVEYLAWYRSRRRSRRRGSRT
jgi:hypothetical protein